MATDHPLLGEDYSLIQDYLLTKIVLALNTDLDTSGWDHEIDAFERESTSFWVRRNALLFDYTLARLLAACPNPTPAPDPKGAGPQVTFVSDFVGAVTQQDASTAEYVWAEVNAGHGIGRSARLPSTVILLAHLRTSWGEAHARTVLDNVPDEMFPPQSVS
ncbi:MULTISPECIES: hypothetical protein [Bacteria]